MESKTLTGTASEIRKLVSCLWHMGSEKINLVDGGSYELEEMFRATWLELRQDLRDLPSAGKATLTVTEAQSALIQRATKMYQQYLKVAAKRLQKQYENALKTTNSKTATSPATKTKRGLFD